MERVRKDTRFELVNELVKLPQSELRDSIIAEAKAGEYHDYKNERYACGKVAVVGHLKKLNEPFADEIAQRVISGEYDEEADADDKVMLTKILVDASFPKATREKLFGL